MWAWSRGASQPITARPIVALYSLTWIEKNTETSMHSSRMGTARLLTPYTVVSGG